MLPLRRLELSYRLDGFRARFGHEHHRAAFIAKRLAHLVGQVFFVLVGKQLVAVDEQQKRRRRLPYLGRVEELQPVPPTR